MSQTRQRRTASDEPFLLVRTSASDMRGGTAIAGHRHGWHQLAYVATGTMALATDAGSWLAPPNWAVWIPAGTAHSIRFVGASALRTAYLRPGWGALPDRCTALAASPLLRELVLRAVALGMLDERHPSERAMAELIAAEIRAAGPPPFALPEPAGEALRRGAIAGAGGADVPGMARAAGMSVRSFERRFRADTGISAARWRQQRRLLDGLEAIAAGAAVKAAAARAGYAAPSAFVAAFRNAFGVTPGRYFG